MEGNSRGKVPSRKERTKNKKNRNSEQVPRSLSSSSELRGGIDRGIFWFLSRCGDSISPGFPAPHHLPVKCMLWFSLLADFVASRFRLRSPRRVRVSVHRRRFSCFVLSCHPGWRGRGGQSLLRRRRRRDPGPCL